MFGLFKSPQFFDSDLGDLRRSRGLWRGSVELAGAVIPLALSGSREAPDPTALELARSARHLIQVARPYIEAAVFEHIQPYVEAVALDELPAPAQPVPTVVEPSEVWPYISFRYVAVTPISGSLVTEFGIAIPWDEEHTLGARFSDRRLLELCGSVLPP
jgi:hypothetical protein